MHKRKHKCIASAISKGVLMYVFENRPNQAMGDVCVNVTAATLPRADAHLPLGSAVILNS